MIDMVSISVIITTYNDYHYLDQAIVSVLKQTLLPKEIIIVDDGSEYLGAETIAKKYVDNKEGVSIFFYRKENGGASSARNYGIEKANGEYLSFLDVDDAMLINNLEEKYLILSKLSPEYFGVYGNAITSHNKKQIFSSSIDGVFNTRLLDVEMIGVPGGIPFYLIRRNLLISLGGFDEDIKCNEDYDLIIRLCISGYKCKSCKTIGYYRNIRKNSLSRPKNPRLNFERIMHFLNKAQKHNFYDVSFLNYRRMEVHMTLFKALLLSAKIKEAIICARNGFVYSKPVNLKQKIVYFLTFSFIKVN